MKNVFEALSYIRLRPKEYSFIFFFIHRDHGWEAGWGKGAREHP